MKNLINPRILTLALLAGLVSPLAAQDWSHSAGPGQISEHAMIRDAVNDRMIVFGGSVNNVLSNATYEYSASRGTWLEIATQGTAPSPRRETLAVYDAERNRMVVFAGESAAGNNNDTFALSLTPGEETWTQIASDSPALPIQRTHGVLVMDTLNDRAMLYGGYNAPGIYHDVWALSLELGAESWGNGALQTIGSPGVTSVGNAGVYDPIGQRMLIFRGRTGLMYSVSLTGTPTWTQVGNADGPQGERRYAAMAYDSEHHAVILHGGLTATETLSETWSLDLHTHAWTRLNDEPLSTGRFWQAAAYDEARDEFVITGGRDFPRTQNSMMASLKGELLAPQLLSPTGGAVVESAEIVLEWAPAVGIGAGGHMLTLMRADGLVELSLLDLPVDGTSVVIIPGIVAEHGMDILFYWSVTAVSHTGAVAVSEMEEFTFVIPPAPELDTDFGSNDEAQLKNKDPNESEMGALPGFGRDDADRASIIVSVGSSEASINPGTTSLQAQSPTAETPRAEDRHAGCAGGGAGPGISFALLAMILLGAGVRSLRKAHN